MLDMDLATGLSREGSHTAREAACCERTGFEVSWATTWAEVREAQRLRYRVFAGEMGARVPSRQHDSAFGCADLPVMLQLDDLPARYRRHFLAAGASN